jgi:predicted RNA-binding Zn-ribbon protein involved in translation (DUF1610 family)
MATVKAHEITEKLNQCNQEIKTIKKKRDEAKNLVTLVILIFFLVIIVGLGIVNWICSIIVIVIIIVLLAVSGDIPLIKIPYDIATSEYDEQLSILHDRKSSIKSELDGYNAKITKLQEAKNLEIAGRFEDAARIYESYQLYEEAGMARRKDRTTYVEQRTIDINVLLNQLRAEGRSTNYKCPTCGGSIRITGSTTTSHLAKCEYCGNEIKIHDLVEFLKSILGGVSSTSSYYHITEDAKSQQRHLCHSCNRPLEWISQYQRWFCRSCQKYV